MGGFFEDKILCCEVAYCADLWNSNMTLIILSKKTKNNNIENFSETFKAIKESTQITSFSQDHFKLFLNRKTENKTSFIR